MEVPKTLILERLIVVLARYLFWVLVMLACSGLLILFLLCAWLFSWQPGEIGDAIYQFSQTRVGSTLQWLGGLLGLSLIVLWRRFVNLLGEAHLWLLQRANQR